MHDSWIERLGEEVLKFQLWGQLFLKGLLEDSWACTASGRMPRARLSTNGAVQILEDSWRMDPTRALHTFLRTLSSLNDTSMIQQSNTLIFKVSVLKCRKHYGKMLQAVHSAWGTVPPCAAAWGARQYHVISSQNTPQRTTLQNMHSVTLSTQVRPFVKGKMQYIVLKEQTNI